MGHEEAVAAAVARAVAAEQARRGAGMSIAKSAVKVRAGGAARIILCLIVCCVTSWDGMPCIVSWGSFFYLFIFGEGGVSIDSTWRGGQARGELCGVMGRRRAEEG